jgi:acyl carrier protein phosphodiesterase
MNHLAHIVLAGPNPGLRLGAFLGDHVKGRRPLEALPVDWARGVVLHRRIDGYCDQHPAVGRFLAGLNPPWRRYAGIILDVLFDHMLTRHWHSFGQGDLDVFGEGIDDLLASHFDDLPERLQRFSLWARHRRLWSRYGDLELLAEIFERLAIRHGRPSPLARGLELLQAHDPRIEAVFLELFEDLAKQARSWRHSSMSSM